MIIYICKVDYCLARGEKPSPSGEDLSMHTVWMSLRLATEFSDFPRENFCAGCIFL
jgi:hypothetical protein